MTPLMMYLVGVGVGVVVFSILGLRMYMSSGTMCKIKVRLEGKVIIITGGNTGIGKATAIECARRGAKVILACRNKVKAEGAVLQIRKRTSSETVHYLPLDLASFKCIREFVDVFIRQYGSAYAIVNNAAYLGEKAKSMDGHDLCFQVNYLGHFLLTQLLISRTRPDKTRMLRVVNLTSDSYKTSTLNFEDLMLTKSPYEIYSAYGKTKLAMLWFTNELNYRFAGSGITSVAVHPGAVKSNLLRNWPGIKGDILRLFAWMFFRNTDTGAQSVIQSLLVDYLEDYVGKIVYDCKAIDIESDGKDYRQAERLWTTSNDLCGLDNHPVTTTKSVQRE